MTFPFPFPNLDTIFPAPSQEEFPAIAELDETQLAAAAGGRSWGAGSGGKVGEVPVVTG